MIGITILAVTTIYAPQDEHETLSAACFISWAGMLIIGRRSMGSYKKNLADIHAESAERGPQMSRAEKLLGIICLTSAAYQLYIYLAT
jgi:hypothetical protein